MMWKTVLFLSLFLSSVPFGIFLCRLHRRFMLLIFGCMIASTYFYDLTSITFFSREWYKTVTWGFDITAIDIGCLILFFSMLLRNKEYKIRLLIPLTIPFLLYFIAQAISWSFVDSWILYNPLKTEGFFEENGLSAKDFEIGLYPLFEMFKILRFYFILWVMTNFIVSKEELFTLTAVFSGLVLLITGVSLFQRYILGYHQVNGGMEHFHILNVYIGMMGCFLCAQLFSIKKFLIKLVIFCIYLCAILTVLLTLGRSALGGLTLASSLLIGLSFIRFPTQSNFLIILLLGVIGLIFFARAYDTLLEKFEIRSALTMFEGRQLLNERAVEMVQNHPSGVGGGNFAAYYTNMYKSRFEDPISLAHNIYYLNLAEYGYLGLFAFLVIQFRVIQILATNFYQKWKDTQIIPYVIGIFGSLTVLQIQELFHFTSRNNSVAFLYLVFFAILSNIYLGRLKIQNIAPKKAKVIRN